MMLYPKCLLYVELVQKSKSRGSLQSFPVGKAREKRGYPVSFVTTAPQSFLRQGNMNTLEVSMDYRDMTPPQRLR